MEKSIDGRAIERNRYVALQTRRAANRINAHLSFVGINVWTLVISFFFSCALSARSLATRKNEKKLTHKIRIIYFIDEMTSWARDRATHHLKRRERDGTSLRPL